MEIFAVIFFVLLAFLGFAMALDNLGEDGRKEVADALWVKFERLFPGKKNKED